jgi:hypothetical protein
MTFELEIPVSNRVMFRQIVALMTTPDRPPTEISQWWNLGASEHTIHQEAVWHRLFASWAEKAQSLSEELIDQIASERHARFVVQYEALKQEEIARSRHWLRIKADLLCGAFVPPTGDLFGEPEPGPGWRSREDPTTRLVAMATDPEVPSAKRRSANETLEILRTMERSGMAPGPILVRPIGMLMIVPDHAP